MIDAINFVKHVSVKNVLNDAWQNYNIKNNRISVFNGTLSAGAPIDCVDCNPDAEQLNTVIAHCDDDLEVNIERGKLFVYSNGMRAHVDCLPDATPVTPPTSDIDIETKNLLPVLKKLRIFAAKNDPRKWAQSIALRGNHAYATDNFSIIRHDLDFDAGDLLLPHELVQAMIAINEEPVGLHIDAKLTFFYANDRWLSSSIVADKFPPMDYHFDPIRCVRGDDIPCDFIDVLQRIKPFVNYEAIFDEGFVGSSPHDGEGVYFEQDFITDRRAYSVAQLLRICNVATHLHFHEDPRDPACFHGDGIAGMFTGVIL